MSELPTDSAATRDLLERAGAGDTTAFEELFKRYRAQLRQLADLRLDSRLRARLDASDIVQETYLEAYRRLGDYLAKRPMPFRLWLRQIAHDRTLKAARDHLTARRRSAARELPLPEESALLLAERLLIASTPSLQFNRHELAQRLRQAMAQLPDTDREILVMRHFDGLSNQDVACLLSLEPGTVSKRHGRAMLRLHKLLFDGGMTDSQL